jgi:drug/metabolite transporter (DMT)-like permease
VGPASVTTGTRPAFYALAPGGWRDYVTLLHPPYTLWHLSYVAIGAGLAPELAWDRLLLALVAFFLGMGVGAHALDELRGRPRQTRIPERVLWVLAAVSIGAAVAVGVFASIVYTPALVPLVAFGGFIAVAYNLELFGGRLHNAFWFAVAWGALPVLAGYVATAERVSDEAVAAAAFASLLSWAQRLLSTPVRDVRRRVASVSGTVVYNDGREEPVRPQSLMGVPEAGLRVLAAATVALAVALVLRSLG